MLNLSFMHSVHFHQLFILTTLHIDVIKKKVPKFSIVQTISRPVQFLIPSE